MVRRSKKWVGRHARGQAERDVQKQRAAAGAFRRGLVTARGAAAAMQVRGRARQEWNRSGQERDSWERAGAREDRVVSTAGAEQSRQAGQQDSRAGAIWLVCLGGWQTARASGGRAI